jgi:hypothetical protein
LQVCSNRFCRILVGGYPAIGGLLRVFGVTKI